MALTDLAAFYFEPNNERPTWPTLDECVRWAQSVNNYPGTSGAATVNHENMQLCLDAAVERISKRTENQVRPVDGTGAVDVGGTPVKIPARVKLATIMQTTKWYRRMYTQDGIVGASDVTGFIRALAFDPDVEAMLQFEELPW